MSMDNYACCADVIEESFVKEICPDEFNNFQEYLENNGSDIEEFASVEDKDEKASKLWKILQSKFQERTGLELLVGFAEAEDRGDEVDGLYWHVEGVYGYTPAGKKYKNKIERKTWTVCG